jgi:predicted Zn-dependent protease
MKSLSLFAALLLGVVGANAQSIEDARKKIYYQRYSEAKQQLRALTAQSNASPDAWYWLGEIYLDEGKPDSAKEVFLAGTDHAVRNNFSRKEYPLAFIGWAHYLMNSGDSITARQQLETILSESKYKNTLALWGAARANIYGKHGDAAWAMDLLARAMKRDGKNPEYYVALGDLHRMRTEGGPAITAFNKVIALQPNRAAAYYKQGKIYKSQNNTAIYLDLFEKAVKADSAYAPALYELYTHHFYYDVAKAREYLNAYIRHSEPSPEHDYMLADLEFIAKDYNAAIRYAAALVDKAPDSTAARLYKLMAYSYEGLNDSAKALENISVYFDKSDTSKHIPKDYELKARLLLAVNNDTVGAADAYENAWRVATDEKEKLQYIQMLADMEKKNGRRDKEAFWRQQIYTQKPQPSNVDLYNWGLALFASENYAQADSVFAIYSEKYPTQVYGYLWRAKSNALIDSSMTLGLAVPHYKKLIEVASADSVKNKALLLGAYGYLGSYEANVTKDFNSSLEYFEKLLELDPGNDDAEKYATTLKKWIEEADSRASSH